MGRKLIVFMVKVGSGVECVSGFPVEGLSCFCFFIRGETAGTAEDHSGRVLGWSVLDVCAQVFVAMKIPSVEMLVRRMGSH